MLVRHEAHVSPEASLVDGRAVQLAEQGAVAIIKPVQNVVRATPRPRSITARIGAVLVPPQQLAALGYIEEMDFSALVEVLASRVQHVRDQVCSAGHLPHHRRGQQRGLGGGAEHFASEQVAESAIAEVAASETATLSPSRPH